jgi:hypothetical protein
MTQHVRTSYRRHRRASWALALGVALLVAAVAIPLATGAPDKTYTMLYPVAGAVTPAPPVAGANNAQTLCTDTTYTVKLVISNTARSAQLGSANVTFPSGVGTVVSVDQNPTFVNASKPAAFSILETANNVVSLRSIGLPPKSGNTTSSITFAVSLTTQPTPASASVTAQVKQSNDFSDSGQNPDANAFDNPAFPTIATQTCNTTISGRVYHDRDADSTFTTGSGAFDNSDLPKAWTVNVFSKLPSASTYTLFGSQAAASGTGLYSVTVPLGRDYKVCVVATAPDDDDAWGLQGPTGNTQCAPLSGTSGPDSAGYLLPALAGPAADRDFIAVPATAVFGPGSSAVITGYEVIAGTNGDKSPTRYTQETWTSGGGVNFRFAPITECAAPANCDDIHLIESMTAEISLASLNGSQVTLRYDDDPDFNDADLVPMPYCNKDPRPDGWPDDETELDLGGGVLPGAHTSCIISGTQTVILDGKLEFSYVVYTSYDGGRRIN